MRYTRKTFWAGAAERTVKTGAQALLSLMTVGQAITAIDWPDALAITAAAMLASILTSLADPDRTDVSISTAVDTIRKGQHDL